MNVKVMSRDNAVDYCRHGRFEPSVIISISNPYTKYDTEPFKSEKNRVIDILRLSFVDADCEGDLDVYGRVASAADLMNDEKANQVVDFVEKYVDYPIIVHCDAGISRSAGVAAAILKHYTGDDNQIFGAHRYAPNMLVYYKILKAFGDWGFIEEDGDIEVEI